MTDTFNVTASFDKTTYNKGDTMTLTISGGDVLTTTTNQQVPSGTLTLTITAADGATSTITMGPVEVNTPVTTTTPESVKMTAVSDTSGRVWTISSGGLTATAIA